MGRLSEEWRATDGVVQIENPIRIGGAREGFASGHEAPSRPAKGRMVEAVMVRGPGHDAPFLNQERCEVTPWLRVVSLIA